MRSYSDETESFKEKFIRKTSAEPLVPIGTLLTVGFLVRGLKAFRDGKSATSQQMMRGRIAAQAFTVATIVIGAYVGFKPSDRPKSMEEKMARESS